MSAAASVQPGQIYRWLGADVHVDEVTVAAALVTIRQDGCSEWRKWAPLPFPAEAELVDPPQSEHNSTCWQVHDDCALTRALEIVRVKVAAKPTDPGLRRLLDLISEAVADHRENRCTAVGECWAVGRSRAVLRGDWP